jgi:N-methylhydantoinase B
MEPVQQSAFAITRPSEVALVPLGASRRVCVHSHMTNTTTANRSIGICVSFTDYHYAIRQGSGSEGQFPGGDGIIRDVRVLVDAQVTLLTERRNKTLWSVGDVSP